ncbi:unnamed protein product [Acanthoscelides obtectus]|uniref:DUF4485 domain-containing protein n=3 Tax=Acanthoscelides obtectus TaxID=200917 RepID=A0A9P0PXV3_ACAOB|nr:unnamed protein product [Acanthoscelides obtectus]CAK1668427.1 hypothetical protein AOBTE_LOCUS26387 [Acanthoscelides obtectus]
MDAQLQHRTEGAKLDLEFRQILCIIKSYIPTVNSNEQLLLFKSWLEKLSAPTTEEAERNRYLLELARQIKDGDISPPFDREPPPGAFQNFPKLNYYLYNPEESPIKSFKNISWPENEGPMNEMSFPVPSHPNLYTFNTPKCSNEGPLANQYNTSPKPPHPPHHSHAKMNLETAQILPLFDDPNYLFRQMQDPSHGSHMENMKSMSQGHYEEHHKNPPKPNQTETSKLTVKGKKKKVDRTSAPVCQSDPAVGTNLSPAPQNTLEPQHLKYDVKESKRNEVAEDSSWCDLTDTSLISMGQLTSFPFVNSIQTPYNSEEKYENDTDCDDMSDTSASSIRSTPDVTEETSRQEVKLKDTNFVPNDWKKIIGALQLRLTETLHQNNNLNRIVDELKNEIKLAKDQYHCSHKRTSDLNRREVEMMKNLQSDAIKKIEENHQEKLDELDNSYKNKMEKLRGEYETKITDLYTARENDIKAKDAEISRLTDIIQQQCTSISNEIKSLRTQLESSMCNNNGERVIVLQKCVSKMDKLFHKSEKEYMKQISKLKQELEIKDRVAQIQLKTQKAELIARTFSEKQKQFDEIINSLEVKYIKMLEHHENQVMETKKQDEEKINSLKSLLHKHDISFDI